MIPYNTDAPLYHIPFVTVGMIVLCSLLFFAVPSSRVQPEINIVEDESGAPRSVEANYPANTLALEYGQGIKPWQWLTSIFMHADLFHLIFNMIALWSFGLVVEGKVGAWVFLGLYLGIGVGQSAIEQTLMSFSGMGGSLGASAAIFGLLGIAMVWAPRNDFDVFWSFGFYAGVIEVPIMVYAFLTIAVEILGVVFDRFSMSSSMLHLMGAGMGVGLGFLWLQRGWVDCEGWDLIHVMKGKEGTKHLAEDAELEGEARALIRTSLKSRSKPDQSSSTASDRPTTQSSTAYAPTTDKPQNAWTPGAIPLGHSPAPEEFDGLFSQLPQASASAEDAGLADLTELIDAGNFTTVLKLLDKLRQSGRAPKLAQRSIGKLVRDLLEAKEFEAAVPFVTEHIHRFPAGRELLQLNLAKIFIHLERPRKAIGILRSVDSVKLDDVQRHSFEKLAKHAKQQIRDGVIEIQE